MLLFINFFNPKFFLVCFLQFFFVKCSNNFFTFKITDNLALKYSIFNFDSKTFLKPIWSVTYCKNIFYVDILFFFFMKFIFFFNKFYFLVIDLYFLIPAVIGHIFIPIVELVIAIKILNREAEVKIESHPVIAEAKIRECSV